MSIWDKSSFLDLVASGLSDATTPEAAYGITKTHAYSGRITIGLILPRMEDPTALLSSSYAAREAVLNGLTADQVGARFGASQDTFNKLATYLAGVKDPAGKKNVAMADSSQLVSSAASRTIWINVDSNAFQTLFGQSLKISDKGMIYWDGTLTPNPQMPTLAGMMPLVYAGSLQATVQDSTAVTLVDGPQGVANTAGGGYDVTNTKVSTEDRSPAEIAASYHFPVQSTGNTSLATPTVGLIEPEYGDTVPAGDDPNTLLQVYRQKIGVSGTGTISEGTTEALPTTTSSQERSLDVGVVAATAPNSDIITYSGAELYPYTAMEEAIWGKDPKVAALSTSFGFLLRPASGSPFQVALQGLYEDAALNNISVFLPSTDDGSSAEHGTGVPQVSTALDSLWATVVGGTSTSNQAQVAAAGAATTDGGPNINADVAKLLQRAITGDVASLQVLVAGGLLQLPKAGASVDWLLQTAWNEYHYQASTKTLTTSYAQNAATGGGVDTDLAEPGYQKDTGIDTQALQTADGVTPATAAWRGIPDVSALADGNMDYKIPTGDMTGLTTSGGTSAATPLWAALAAQIQAVFTDQGLPALGTFNDLLYQAAVIDPGAFNDVQFGSNTSSFYVDPNGSVTAVQTRDANGKVLTQETITPTGLGYSAHQGYDLVSGLGTPDGILLARALTQIAQAQMYSPGVTPVSDSIGQTSTVNQALIVEASLAAGTEQVRAAGSTFRAAAGNGTGWSARVAQQVLQSYFSMPLVAAIAGQPQNGATQVTVAAGQSLAATIGGAVASPTGQADTAAYGFVNDTDAAGDVVTYARPLAVAETYGGQDGTEAIVRIRQTSADVDSLTLYRVDDLLGNIDGIAPGQAGYVQAAAARAYQTTTGDTAIAAPSQDGFAQSVITGVNDGDIIGFELTDATSGQQVWGLAPENATGANALWSYGADTWGFNDGSGDGSYADTVFQLDFTSEAGHALLATDTGTVTLTALTATPDASGPLNAGHTIGFTLAPSEALSIDTSGGTPTLTLNDGATASYTGQDSDGHLLFTTTVAAGQDTADLQVTGLALNGAVATDTAGNPLDTAGVAGLPGSDTGLVIDTTPPAVTLSLSDDTGVSATDRTTADPALSGTADPNALVTVTEGSSVIGTATAADDGTWHLTPTGLADGDHTLTASETDAAGNVGIATIAITLETVAAPPRGLGLFVTAGRPLRPGASVTNTSTPTIFGTGAAGDTILLTTGGQAAGAATVAADGTWQARLAAPLAGGVNAITATSHDLAGNVSAPATLKVTVLPAADASGVTEASMSSTELAAFEPLRQFTANTNEVSLLDGTLSVSPYTNVSFVARLYEGALGRGPDTLGLGGWSAQLASGASQAAVASGVLSSPEFAASKQANGSDAQFVTSLYQNGLGRAPDQPGLDASLSGLQSGTVSRADVLASLAASGEAEQHWAGLTSELWAPDPTASLVRSVYEIGLGRDAEDAGLKHWTNLLDADLTAQDFARDVAGTAEFQALHSGQTNQQFVTALYQSGLGRAPDAAGLSAWVSGLQSGMTRADVLLGFAASPEGLAHVPQAL